MSFMRFRFGLSKVTPFSTSTFSTTAKNPLNPFKGTLFRTYQTSPFCYVFLTNHMSTVEQTFDQHWLKFKELKIPHEQQLQVAKLLVDHNVADQVFCVNSLRNALKNIFKLPEPKQLEQKRKRMQELQTEHKIASQELLAAQKARSPHLEKEIYSRRQEALHQAQTVENTLLMRIHETQFELEKLEEQQKALETPAENYKILQSNLQGYKKDLSMATKVTQRAQKEFDQPLVLPDYQAEHQRVYNAEVRINQILAEMNLLSLELNDPSVITDANYSIRFSTENQKRIAASPLDRKGEVQEYCGDNSYKHYSEQMKKLKEELNIDAILDPKKAPAMKMK